jgi:Kef-type K+ transport system membrane component KefB
MTVPQISIEMQYLLVVVGLFVVPRVLQRVRIPSAITCLALGAGLNMGFGLFHDDAVIPLLSVLGIVSLFLFAGLEVRFEDLRRGLRVTLGHLLLQVLLLSISTWAAQHIFDLGVRASVLMSLAILTPSTGFILDSLPAFGLSPQQQYWVKTKAIAAELVALATLFLVVQSGSIQTLTLATGALIAMVAALPWIFRAFAEKILPFAPKSEFAFVLILAILCAYLTRHLGVYYLVGAFLVGVTAVRLRKQLPALASDRLIIGIELFASFFVPFYFFKAGLHLKREYFTWQSILLGVGFVALIVPLRIGVAAYYRRWSLSEPVKDGVRVGLSLVPTLVFTFVLADILHERFGLPDHLFGALVVFALVNTTLPGFFLRLPPPEFAAPEASEATVRFFSEPPGAPSEQTRVPVQDEIHFAPLGQLPDWPADDKTTERND